MKVFLLWAVKDTGKVSIIIFDKVDYLVQTLDMILRIPEFHFNITLWEIRRCPPLNGFNWEGGCRELCQHWKMCLGHSPCGKNNLWVISNFARVEDPPPKTIPQLADFMPEQYAL